MTTTILAKNVSNIGPPGGGMLMSTMDLEKWIRHLLIKKNILPAKQLNEMLTGVAIPDNKINLPHPRRIKNQLTSDYKFQLILHSNHEHKPRFVPKVLE